VEDHASEVGISIVSFRKCLFAVRRRVPQKRPSSGGRSVHFPVRLGYPPTRAGRPSHSGLGTFPEVIAELEKAYPPPDRQGFTIFMTGLSGAGKSTIAKILYSKFLERGDRPVTLLDGDIVRQNLSSELTFSKEHRDINVKRIGFVASEITRTGGSPFAPDRAVCQNAG